MVELTGAVTTMVTAKVMIQIINSVVKTITRLLIIPALSGSKVLCQVKSPKRFFRNHRPSELVQMLGDFNFCVLSRSRKAKCVFSKQVEIYVKHTPKTIPIFHFWFLKDGFQEVRTFLPTGGKRLHGSTQLAEGITRRR